MTKAKQSITIRDVAERAGVSVATISRFLNRNAAISPQTEERIQQAMSELNFVPSAVARKLATTRHDTIGLIITDLVGDYFAPLLSGVEFVARQNGYDLLISSSRQENRHPGSGAPLGPHNVDGLLVFPGTLLDDQVLKYFQNEFPMVLIHCSPPAGLAIPSVTVENKAASFNLVSHLIAQHGRRRIVYLRGPEQQEDSFWREQGYMNALRAAGLPFDPLLIGSGGFSRTIAAQAIHTLLQEGIVFDAVFSGDDEASVGVLDVLASAGIKVPEQVSVVGFDDQRMAPFLTPPLTTIRAPTEQVGLTAARQLINLVQKKNVPGITLLPTELIVRQSCGCSPV